MPKAAELSPHPCTDPSGRHGKVWVGRWCPASLEAPRGHLRTQQELWALQLEEPEGKGEIRK